MKEWTVMVYLAGDNNLSEECVWSLKEMYRAGLRTDKIALVVQIDPRARRMQHFDLGEDLEALKRERRYTAKNGQKKVSVTYSPPPVSNDGRSGFLSLRGRSVATRRRRDFEPNYPPAAASVKPSPDSMASPEALTSFIKRSKAKHRAKHYLLILAGHGAGTVGDSFLVDGFPASALSMSELSEALKNAGGIIDVLGMDACSMGMVEIGYQLRGSVRYLVAAEGFEINTGWPYDKVLDALNAKPKIEPRELAAQIVVDYTAYYSDYLMAGVSTDLSACDLSKSKDLVTKVSGLAELLGQNLHRANGGHRDSQQAVTEALLLAHWRAQSYRFEEYTDLWDFCDLLERDLQVKPGPADKVAYACSLVKNAIEGTLVDEKDGTTNGYVIRSGRSGGAFQHSHGVSIYFPWAKVLPPYSDLMFSQDTSWDDFLKAYVEKTRRPPRAGFGKLIPVSEEGDSVTGKRDVLAAGNRDVLTAGNKGGEILVPQIKNPPSHFHPFDELKADSAKHG